MNKPDEAAKTTDEPTHDPDGVLFRDCSKGGKCQWRIDGMHSNVFCGKCFRPHPSDG